MAFGVMEELEAASLFTFDEAIDMHFGGRFDNSILRAEKTLFRNGAEPLDWTDT